ncbi:DNA-binding transcriptional regulator [Bombiscardovia apis]|uniref:DNA-binding transcriptional regulator n=1 Tax=Bombiscardovia apis TaxID=2932182 RepID=A0ABM8BDW1_9BIFI|nr:WYL domain-containing protein [Bombiscardovia apis]BDR55068.1 DNA-binding transcriptional regulator [Bombiscardovia apis]
MSKSERINQELLFVHERRVFQLSDLITEFHISRRTALRDLSELSRLGVPITAFPGRYGGYQVEDSTPLPPVSFSENEQLTIFFALQLLKTVSNSPFGHTYRHIQDKLLQVFPESRRELISNAMAGIRYEGPSQQAPTEGLAIIFETIMRQHTLVFLYPSQADSPRSANPILLTLNGGFWYCTAFDNSKQQWRTYRCDRMRIIGTHPRAQGLPSPSEERRKYESAQTQARTINFKVDLTSQGKDRFTREHFPNMRLEEEAGQARIVGAIRPDELDFLVRYLLGFGDQATIAEPASLRKRYRHVLEELLKKLGARAYVTQLEVESQR